MVGLKDSKRIQLIQAFRDESERVLHIECAVLRPIFQARDALCSHSVQASFRALDGIAQAWQTFLPIVGLEDPK